MNGAQSTASALFQDRIGSVDPDALKILARRAEYSLAESAPSPFQAEPKQPFMGNSFFPLWVRDPVEDLADGPRSQKEVAAGGSQMRLYLGPELVKPRR